MSFVYKKKKTPNLSLVVEESTQTPLSNYDIENFDEINIKRTISRIGSVRGLPRPISTMTSTGAVGAPGAAIAAPVERSRSRGNSLGSSSESILNVVYESSPLKNQVPQRSSSITSTTSNVSNKSNNSQESSYIVSVNKTPSNLTPSQRLKLRKTQLNDSISKFKDYSNVVQQQQQQQQKHQQIIEQSRQTQRQHQTRNHQQPRRQNGNSSDSFPFSTGNVDEDDDEDIDSEICMFNVPISQPLSAISQRERYTYTNNDRKLSLTTDSTRSSSILSHTSLTDTGSITSYEDDLTRTANTSFSSSYINMEDLKLSQDAEQLTLLFNKNDYVQINEESRQKQKMLNSFKKVNLAGQQGEQDFHSEGNEPTNSDISNNNDSYKNPSIRAPSPQVRALSTASIKNKRATGISPASSIDPRSLSTSTLKTTTPPNEIPSPLQMVGPGNSTTKYFSFTRPTWLPPKSSSDKKKHQKESEYLIKQALQRETDQKNRKIAELERLKKQKQKDLQIWEDEIVPDGGITVSEADYQKRLKTNLVKDMYWRGLPSTSLRSRLWFKQIGNGVQLSEHTCNYYFQKARKFRSKVTKFDQLLLTKNNKPVLDSYIKKSPSILKMKGYMDKLNADLLDTFPDHNFFQNPETISRIIDTVTSFILYLNETNQGIEIDDEKFRHINLNYYFTGLNNLSGILFYHYNRSCYRTFISLCNVFQRPLLNLLLGFQVHCIQDELEKNSDGALTSQQRNLLLCSLNDAFIDNYEQKFKEKLNRLAVHFSVINLQPIEYISNILLGIFSNFLDFQLSSHILDVYAFEGDDFLVSCLLGVLSKISFKLYGTKKENLEILGEHYRSVLNSQGKQQRRTAESYKYLNVGLEHEFIEIVKELHT
ncbi:hypothetical protein CLIB1423_17S00166 [[Candida] railenensis]|uniref:Rab-GAP TBC domain-containing protein n=1 Tax=[Candida] railenensis TaxID=45579 RepID=A0A9P0VZ44_9ASCO|nr:hypothetical protein CLIB1423_17S00166 [[Candida] railenensis]